MKQAILVRIIAALQEATPSLIKILLASEAFTRYVQARACLDGDREARSLLEQLTQSQARLRQKQAGGVTPSEIDDLRKLQTKVQHNSIILEYVQSQQEAINLLHKVNNEIGGLLGFDFAMFTNRATC